MAPLYTSYYEVDPSGNGILPCGTAISTYIVEDNFPPLDLSHPNLLPIFFNNYAKKEVVCARKGATLSEWLEGAPSRLKRHIVKEESKVPLVEAVHVFSFSVHFRNFIGGMLRGVCHLHKKGHSVKDLSEENICLSDGEVKFWKLNLIKTSIESQNQNFASIADIISSTITQVPENLNHECPRDMTNFLNLLRSDRAALQKEKILRHVALLSPDLRLMLVDDMFLIGRREECEARWGDVAEAFFMAAGLNDWEVKFKDKIIGYVLDCFNYRTIPYTVKLDEDGNVTEANVVDSFLNFLRNLVYHLGHNKKTGKRLSKEHIDAILFWGFGDEIILLLQCLDSIGLELPFWSEISYAF